jgi:hypothetical protein
VTTLELCRYYLDKYQVIFVSSIIAPDHTRFYAPDNMHSPFSVFSVLTTVSAVAAQATGGSGQYKASAAVDSSLPKHTIYAPKTVPAGIKFPMLTWGNSGCAGDGVGFATFLTEVASHGYVIVVSGQ